MTCLLSKKPAEWHENYKKSLIVITPMPLLRESKANHVFGAALSPRFTMKNTKTFI